ncbi:MAG: endolytic transglycosylase MltG [Deltaproteobacteria bacterium]|nr:MAG: endolytic transglycosylase MltG [Deltaproteobacteria bacterium]
MVSQKLKVALAALFAMACLLAFLLMDTPPSREWRKAKVVIPKGSSSSDVTRLLAEGKVLQHPVVFRMLVLGTMTRKRLRYGEYSFTEPPSVVEVWRKLVGGEVTRYSVTIPEGSNLYDIAKILGDLDLADPQKFLETAASGEVLRRLDVPGPTAEGFLFPDTYLLEKSLPPEDILEIMVRQFRRKFPPEWEFRGRAEGFSLLQVITIASIIEKETGVAEEKPIVSAVIRKRLALGMPLQMDPTVIYGLQRFGAELSRKDLQSRSPYNSYVNRGLPPGPISNPGLPAIRAAVFPADTDFLYFVSRNDGSHKFSRTLEEHIRGVASYRRDKSEE